MPLAKERVQPDRLHFQSSLTSKEIQTIVQDPKVHFLQCAGPVDPRTWDLTNDLLFPNRPDIELRVYGFYGRICDLSFLRRINRVRRLSLDCLADAEGIENLQCLTELESLGVGISSLDNFDFLADIPHTLTTLSLSATRSKKPALGLLRRFSGLSTLYLEGQQKEIEVLSELKELGDLTLRSISTPNLDYLTELAKLTSLDIKLGGIRDLSAIREKASLKYLELWQVRGLGDISVISTLYGLQYLFLQSLKHVRSLPDLSKLPKLRRILLEDLKGLEDVSSLTQAVALEDFAHLSAQNMTVAQYDFLTRIPTLKTAFIGFGSLKKNELIKAKLDAVGVGEYSRTPFVFV